MTQNLDFSLSTSTRLNSTNTDLNSAGSGIYTDGYTVGIDGTIYYTPSVSTVTNVAQTSNQDTTPQSYDPGTVYYYQGSTAGSPAASSTCTGSGDTCKHWHAGNYYNWNAAVASNNSAGQTTQTHATNSVCPAGWQLPSANDNIFGYSDLNTLFVQQNIVQNYVNANTNAVWTSNGYNDIQGAPLYFTRIGSFSSSTLNSTATNGLYIANLLDGSKKAYNLFFNNSQLQPSSAMGAANGIAVRCIVRDPIYMQEVTTSQLAALMPSSGNSVKLTDERDGKAYTVTNINGSYWMTQNLNLTTAATSSLSNFTGPGFNPCSGDLLTGNSVDEARCHTSGDTTYGTWYNYYSATAGTISTDNSAENATQDICPSGWRLPTNSEFSSITSYASTFSPVVGGRYINGTLEAAYGYWWSSTVASGYNRYALRYIGSSMASQVSGRSDGLYIRCLKS